MKKDETYLQNNEQYTSKTSRRKPVATAVASSSSYNISNSRKMNIYASYCIYQIIEKQNCSNLLRRRCRGYDAWRFTVFSNALS